MSRDLRALVTRLTDEIGALKAIGIDDLSEADVLAALVAADVTLVEATTTIELEKAYEEVISGR